MLTPLYFARTLAAGGVASLDGYGRYILIASITASTIQLSINDEPFQQVTARERIDCGKRPYHRVILRNAGLVAATITGFQSEEPVSVDDDAALMPAIAASLASIDQEISGAGALTQLALVNVAITGGAGTQLFAANAARRLISLSTPPTNGGFVYLGDAAGNVSATDFLDVLYPGSNWYDERYKGAVFAVGNDALEWIGGYEL